uniref:Cytochrome c assembly protein domain-containing protein n=1 Tax=Salix viminalis TaxID=40686 RepID=A0A6N2NJ21_SALVM
MGGMNGKYKNGQSGGRGDKTEALARQVILGMLFHTLAQFYIKFFLRPAERWYSKKSIQINKKWYLLMKCHCMDLPPPTAREAFDGEFHLSCRMCADLVSSLAVIPALLLRGLFTSPCQAKLVRTRMSATLLSQGICPTPTAWKSDLLPLLWVLDSFGDWTSHPSASVLSYNQNWGQALPQLEIELLLRKLIVGFYRSESCCEEILVPVKIASIIKGGIGIRWFDKPRKNNHRLVLTLKRPALLLGWASLYAPTPNKGLGPRLSAIGNGITRKGVEETRLRAGGDEGTRPPNPAGQGRAGHRFESCHLSCGSSCGYRMMGITKQKFGNEHEMSIYELFHYSLFPGPFVAFTYNKKQPPATPFYLSLVTNKKVGLRPVVHPFDSDLVDSELRLQRNRTFDGPALFYAPLYPERRMSFAPLGARRSRGSQEGKRTHPLLHLARDDKERASSIDEKRIDGALGIALFFSLFLSAKSNPVPQDPISAIHPPCIYAGDVASAMGFGLCRSKMMNGIVSLHSPPMRKDAVEKKGTLLRSAGCVGSRITSEFFTLKFKHVGAKCYPALLLRSNRSPLMLLRRRFLAFSSLWTGAHTGGEQTKRVFRNGKKETTISPLCWTAGANTVVSDQDQEPIRIWILTCWWLVTVGILPGSWWAHHELGRGGWWFRDPVENASFMPRVLATARTFSIRSGLLAPVHSFATDDTRGIFLWRFFLLMTGISMILFSQMKQQASYSCAPTALGSRATPPRYVMEELNFLLGLVLRASNWLLDFDPKLEKDRFGGHYGVAECRAVRP